jgi:hypothetical protein
MFKVKFVDFPDFREKSYFSHFQNGNAQNWLFLREIDVPWSIEVIWAPVH